MLLHLGGLATLANVFLNGELILNSRSMFASHMLDVSERINASNELAICFRALAPELAVRRKPRARWRTSLANGNLRFFRTMLLGRAPGFAPGPAVVGPWRPVRLERRSGFALDEVRLQPRVSPHREGKLEFRFAGRIADAAREPRELSLLLTGPSGTHQVTVPLLRESDVLVAAGELRIPSVALWWPHTHGSPVLYELVVSAAGEELKRTRVGFRTLDWPPDWEATGLAVQVNEVPIFARGAVWTPLDMRAPHQPEPVLREALEQFAAAGMNMLRVPGIGCYESDAFYDLCDELGIMVWQDFMLANLDYPVGDPEWNAELVAEVRQELGRLVGRPSLTVICGGSEVAQQVTMLGLDPTLALGELYTSMLPRLVEEADARVAYIPNSPWGGTLPFRPGQGVANYYGVGAYLRELDDARLSEVKFAGECLAFSNVPDDATLEQIQAPGGLVPPHPVWKAGIPRDAGAGWDFEDVRDHYLRTVFGEDPFELRRTDVRRYWQLSREVTGHVMADAFGEWRRSASACAGALVLWLRDLQLGAGWGIIDHTGRPKVAYHHLRRALAPVAVWVTDEGLNGMEAHVANDRAEPLAANLRVALYRRGELRVEQGSLSMTVVGNGTASFDLEGVLGRFADVGFDYRFGPSNHDVVVASLETGSEAGDGLISQAFRYPPSWAWTLETAQSLGIDASVDETATGTTLRIVSRKLVRGVRIETRGWIAADDAFTLEPGVGRRVSMVRRPDVEDGSVGLTALNMADRLRI